MLSPLLTNLPEMIYYPQGDWFENGETSMKKQLWGAFFICVSILYAGEADPQFFTFTIKKRILTGTQFESARTPVVKTALQKDIFIVELKTEFLGKGNIDLPIPPQAGKLKLFDCVFDLPPPDVTAYIQTFPLVEIRKPWYHFSKDESQWALLLIYFDQKQTEFTAQLFYRGRAGNEVWTHHRLFNCKISPEKQIISNEKNGDTFFIKDGNLYINLETTGKYHKYLKKTTRRVLSYQEL